MPNQAIILQNVLQDMRKLLVVKPLNHDNIILMDLQTDLFDDVAPIQEEFEPFQDEIIPSDADSGYVPTTEEEAEEDVPECPLPGESEEDEEALGEITSGISVTASIACDTATVLPQADVQEMFQESFNQGCVTSSFGATANPEEKFPKMAKVNQLEP